jgi:S-adenosylmethionine:tRNA-ribosyltransferase-isomerase (queuine synthetase)
MKPSELDYDLPPEQIAQRPLAERDASRMLLLGRATGSSLSSPICFAGTRWPQSITSG